MKIFLLAPGNSTHSKRFLQLLVSAGNRVVFVDRHHPGCDVEFQYHPYPGHPWLKNIRPHWLRQMIADLIAVVGLRGIWLKEAPDVVHLLGIDRRAYHCAVARINPLILTAWGSDINDAYESNSNDNLRSMMEKALRKADHVTSDTNQILERCSSIARRQLSTSIFYFGIDLELFTPRSEYEKNILRGELNIPEASRIILSPRRLLPKLGHLTILQAFAKLSQIGVDHTVLIFRRFSRYPTSYEQELVRQSEMLGVNELVYWVDEMEYNRLPVLYSLADVIINFPEQDGLPVTLFEASACMKPVITSDLDAYQPFLKDGEYERVPSGNAGLLSESMKNVLMMENHKLHQSLQKNISLIRTVADQRVCLKQIEEIYSRHVLQ